MSNPNIVLASSQFYPEHLSEATKPFTANDFDRGQLSANTPSNYSTPEKVADTLSGLSKYGYRFILASGMVEQMNPLGEVALMDKNATTMQKVVRRLKLDSFGIGLSRVRTISGWYNRGLEVEDQVAFSTEVVDRVVKIGNSLGLKSIETVISEEKAGKNPDLVIIEHTADLSALGFEQKETFGDIKDQGRTYSGAIWRIDT